MSRGYGRVQSACLLAIAYAERAGELPTTYDIAAAVYRTEVNDDGYHLTDAQHVAVKRALESLQRQGKVIGIASRYCHGIADTGDYRNHWRYCWMSEPRAQQWIREQDPERATWPGVKTFKAKMRAIGMKP
jgi:hypothetical protein